MYQAPHQGWAGNNPTGGACHGSQPYTYGGGPYLQPGTGHPTPQYNQPQFYNHTGQWASSALPTTQYTQTNSFPYTQTNPVQCPYTIPPQYPQAPAPSYTQASSVPHPQSGQPLYPQAAPLPNHLLSPPTYANPFPCHYPQSPSLPYGQPGPAPFPQAGSISHPQPASVPVAQVGLPPGTQESPAPNAQAQPSSHVDRQTMPLPSQQVGTIQNTQVSVTNAQAADIPSRPAPVSAADPVVHEASSDLDTGQSLPTTRHDIETTNSEPDLAIDTDGSSHGPVSEIQAPMIASDTSTDDTLSSDESDDAPTAAESPQAGPEGTESLPSTITDDANTSTAIEQHTAHPSAFAALQRAERATEGLLIPCSLQRVPHDLSRVWPNLTVRLKKFEMDISRYGMYFNDEEKRLMSHLNTLIKRCSADYMMRHFIPTRRRRLPNIISRIHAAGIHAYNTLNMNDDEPETRLQEALLAWGKFCLDLETAFIDLWVRVQKLIIGILPRFALEPTLNARAWLEQEIPIMARYQSEIYHKEVSDVESAFNNNQHVQELRRVLIMGTPGAEDMLEELFKLQPVWEPEDEAVHWIRLAPPKPTMPDPLESSEGFDHAPYEIVMSLPGGRSEMLS
jgi:hypothetical protein